MSNNNLRANNWNCTSDEAFNAITVLQTVPFATQAYLHFVVNLRVALKPIPLHGIAQTLTPEHQILSHLYAINVTFYCKGKWACTI